MKLRVGLNYTIKPKPDKVEVGQVWHRAYDVGKSRPYAVVEIVQRPGCSTTHPPSVMIDYAIFRKNKHQPCYDMLSNTRWLYYGTLQDKID